MRGRIVGLALFAASCGGVTEWDGEPEPGEGVIWSPRLETSDELEESMRDISYTVNFEDEYGAGSDTDLDHASMMSVAVRWADGALGSYRGWCVDNDHFVTDGAVLIGEAYSSYEALPPGHAVRQTENLDALNYLLNVRRLGSTFQVEGETEAKELDYDAIQGAVWHLVAVGVDDYLQDLYDMDLVYALVEDALLNGEGYEPPPGGVLAGILVNDQNLDEDPENDVQTLAIELPIAGGHRICYEDAGDCP